MSETITLTENELRKLIKVTVNNTVDEIYNRLFLNEYRNDFEDSFHESKRLFYTIFNITRSTEPTISNENYKVFSGEIPYDVYNNKIKVNYRMIVFENRNKMRTFLNKTADTRIKVSWNPPDTLLVAFYAIGKQFNFPKLIDDISSELSHIRIESEKYCKTDNMIEECIDNPNRDNLYSYARNLIEENAENTYAWIIGALLCDIIWSEKSENIRDTYNSMIVSNEEPDVAFKHTETSIILDRMNENYKNFNKVYEYRIGGGVILDIQRKFGMTYGELNRFIYRGKRKFEEKITELKSKYSELWSKNCQRNTEE